MTITKLYRNTTRSCRFDQQCQRVVAIVNDCHRCTLVTWLQADVVPTPRHLPVPLSTTVRCTAGEAPGCGECCLWRHYKDAPKSILSRYIPCSGQQRPSSERPWLTPGWGYHFPSPDGATTQHLLVPCLSQIRTSSRFYTNINKSVNQPMLLFQEQAHNTDV